ncbi:hypothetical protein P8935_05705 [Telmatobacter sp. DSM 110680]|uniref:Uncharacterized protein n=1 Tax=Telmatobacter sp. DSM 110680 TaxID=3036704 RepID=A0AAU7DND3_9BACT
MDESKWIEIDGGSAVGRKGSEGGTTIKDEEHSRGARITLERDTQIAPFAITCGIYGWMVHTRFFRNHVEALREYEQMKMAMSAILSRIPNAADENLGDDQTGRISSEIEDFLKLYP